MGYGKYKWKDVAISFSVELELVWGEPDNAGNRIGTWTDLTYGKELPINVRNELGQLLLHGPEGVELDFDVRSSGYYDPGRTYGDPYYCYPPEGEDERVCEGVSILVDGKPLRNSDGKVITLKCSGDLEELYQEEIQAVDLPETDYEGDRGDYEYDRWRDGD